MIFTVPSVWNRLFVRVEGLDVDRDFVFWTIDVSFGTRIDVVTLASNAHGVAGNDLAPRRIDDARFDAILEILIVVLARRVEGQLCFAG